MKVAVVGLGFMGTTHLGAWAAIPEVVIGAVVCRDPAKIRSDGITTTAGNLDRPALPINLTSAVITSDIDAVLGDPSIDIVDICLPTYLHESNTIAALQAGKHVLVEKPMALDRDSCNRMLDAAKASDRILMAAQVLRFWPDYQPLIRAHRDGSLGSARAWLFRRRCAAPAWGKWLQDAALSGGGVLDLLIHDVDLAVHLLGEPAYVSATGVEDLPHGIDVVTASLHYDKGPEVTITGGWHHAVSYPFSMEYTATFDDGTIDYSSAGRVPTLYRKGEDETLRLPAEDGFHAEIAYFVDCIKNGKLPARCRPEESAAAVGLTRWIASARKQHGEKIRWNQ